MIKKLKMQFLTMSGSNGLGLFCVERVFSPCACVHLDTPVSSHNPKTDRLGQLATIIACRC